MATPQTSSTSAAKPSTNGTTAKPKRERKPATTLGEASKIVRILKAYDAAKRDRIMEIVKIDLAEQTVIPGT